MKLELIVFSQLNRIAAPPADYVGPRNIKTTTVCAEIINHQNAPILQVERSLVWFSFIMSRESVEPERVQLAEEGLLIGFRCLTFDGCMVSDYKIGSVTPRASNWQRGASFPRIAAGRE